MYGETQTRSNSAYNARGLSPHVRGNLLLPHYRLLAQGSIPACTGKPAPVREEILRLAVYPRMYGETSWPASFGIFVCGLSPHVRGNLRPPAGGGRPVGSIPACTGKPTSRRSWRARHGVYPRMYGETSRQESARIGSRGLSPHVRGNRGGVNAGQRRIGSIPACTGKPFAGRFIGTARRVYPRMYGETKLSGILTDIPEGLSPHVRGNRRTGNGHGSAAGSIPACTGKP